MAADVFTLERVGYDIWIAPEVEELDGWRLRFAHGLTKRGNSAWPNADGELPLAEKIYAVEDWYRRRGLPATFHVSPAARPAELEAELERRSYRDQAPATSVETAPLTPLSSGGDDVELLDEPDDDWIAIWTESRGFGRPDVAHRLLTGSDGPAAFARVGDVAVGRGVAVDGWLGITSMVTIPAARCRGHARAILGAIARWALAHGCERALIQVESTNEPARRLYSNAGFRSHYEYRYMTYA